MQSLHSRNFTAITSQSPDALPRRLNSTLCRPLPRATAATIFTFDLTSFITDSQQQWLTQPPNPPPGTPSTVPSLPYRPELSEDFTLFPPSPQPPHRQVEPVRVTSSTPLDSIASPAPVGTPNLNPAQSAIARTSVQNNQSFSSACFGASAQQIQHRTLYSNSAPTSSVALQGQSVRERPPVPLFAASTASAPHSSKMEGNDSHPPVVPVTILTHKCSGLHSEFAGFDSFEDTGALNFFDQSAGPANSLDMTTLDSIQSPYVPDQTTVSPRDLMHNSSAPPSGVTTNLSTPQTGLFESPGMVHSTETSPLFGSNEELDGDAENWDSLFPPDNGHDVSPMLDPTAPAMGRSQSSPGSQHMRHSSVSGVRSRRRDKPLPAIDYTKEANPTVRKRMKNTEAARKSRAKKQERVEAMQDRIDELENEVAHWKRHAAELQSTIAKLSGQPH